MRAAGRLHRKCSERGEAPSARMASKGVEPDTSTVRLSRGSDRLQPLTRTRGHRDMSSGSAGCSKGHRALRLLRAPPRAMRTDSKGEGPGHPPTVPQQRAEPEAQTSGQQFWAEAAGRSAQRWGPRCPGPGEGLQAPFQ